MARPVPIRIDIEPSDQLEALIRRLARDEAEQAIASHAAAALADPDLPRHAKGLAGLLLARFRWARRKHRA